MITVMNPITALVVQDSTAVYTLETITPERAADMGCPGATHRYTSNYGTVYGRWEETTGKIVRPRRTGWYSARAIHGRFVVREDNRMFNGTGAVEDRELFKGWAMI